MRYLVLLFGLAGLGATGFVTFHIGTDWLAYDEVEKLRLYEAVQKEHDESEKQLEQLKTPAGSKPPEVVKIMLAERDRNSLLNTWPTNELVKKHIIGDLPDYNDKMKAFFNFHRMLPFLLSALFLGLIGIFVAYDGNGFSGAALLIVAGAVPGLFYPRMLIATGALIVAGLCALCVRPRRRKEPKPVDA